MISSGCLVLSSEQAQGLLNLIFVLREGETLCIAGEESHHLVLEAKLVGLVLTGLLYFKSAIWV